MSYSADGCFLPWDPQRPCRAHPCAHCLKPDATKRCTRCALAHYCNKECQQAHWAAHKGPCKAGLAAYVDAIAGQVRKQAELLKRANVAEEVIAELKSSLAMARAIGDAEGERHLCSSLAYRCSSLAEAGGEGAPGHVVQSEQYTGRAAAILECIGPQDYKGVARAVGKGAGPKLPSMTPSAAGGGVSGRASPPAPDLGTMFGAPTEGDPLGLLSDFSALPMSGRSPAGGTSAAAPSPPVMPVANPRGANGGILDAPPSPPDDRPA